MFKAKEWKKVIVPNLKSCPDDVAKHLDELIVLIKVDKEKRFDFQKVYTDAVIVGYDVKQYYEKYKKAMEM